MGRLRARRRLLPADAQPSQEQLQPFTHRSRRAEEAAGTGNPPVP